MRTLIIGAGLSGLALAEMMEAQGRDYIIVEARDRVGGRIKTERYGGGDFDMGPAWFWPAQPRIAALIARLGLERFDQYSAGDLLFEDAQGQVQRGRGFASMQGSWRLKGGMGALTQALADKVPEGRLHLGAQVTALVKSDAGVTATLRGGDDVTADKVVLALPPRIAAGISYAPALPAPVIRTMQGVSTWMAGQAKAVAVYDTPFWRDAGLSGDASSRFGPMVEMHDASPATGNVYGLFGFIGVPPEGRGDVVALRRQITAQLIRVFGPKAADPLGVYVTDWAYDPQTATRADLAPLYAHPTYGMPDDFKGVWADTLHFAGTEVAAQFGGYLEGALEAAEAVLADFDALKV